MDYLLTFTWYFVGICSAWGMIGLLKQSRIITRLDLLVIIHLGIFGPIIACLLITVSIFCLIFSLNSLNKPIKSLSIGIK